MSEADIKKLSPANVVSQLKTYHPMTLISEIDYTFSTVSEGHMIIPVKINGKGPFPFILDTGASHICISQELSEKLQLSGANSDVMGIHGTFETEIAELRSVSLGKARRLKLLAALMDISHVQDSLGIEVHGILGYDFLKKFKVLIDYPKRKIQIYR